MNKDLKETIDHYFEHFQAYFFEEIRDHTGDDASLLDRLADITKQFANYLDMLKSGIEFDDSHRRFYSSTAFISMQNKADEAFMAQWKALGIMKNEKM